MSDATSPSINDLVKRHAWRSYEETEQYQDDLDTIADLVVDTEDGEHGLMPVTLGHVHGGTASFIGRSALEVGFQRGYESRDEHFANLDNAYGELVSHFTDNNGVVLVYSQMIARIQARFNEADAMSTVPVHIMQDLDQIIHEGTLRITGALPISDLA